MLSPIIGNYLECLLFLIYYDTFLTMGRVIEVESRSPYTNPTNLDVLRRRLQTPRGSFLSVEYGKVNLWIGFIQTALTTLEGEGALMGYQYGIEFGRTQSGISDFMFQLGGGLRIAYSVRYGTEIARVQVPSVESVVPMDDNTIVIEGGEAFRTKLIVSTSGKADFFIEPRSQADSSPIS